MGIPDHLTCLLRNLYVGEEVTELCMEQLIGSKNKKGVQQGFLLSPCLFKLYVEQITRHARLAEIQAGIKIGRRSINNL